MGNFSPHLNAGYTYTSRGGLPGASLHSEWNYAAGVDVAVSPRLTLIADVLGRIDSRPGAAQGSRYDFRFRGGGPRRHRRYGRRGRWWWRWWRVWPTPNRPVEHVTKRQFRLEPGNLNLAVGNAGVRFNPFRKMLVSANLLFALTEAGLRDRVTPVISARLLRFDGLSRRLEK